ncbi:MAG: hypothetical protein K6E53_03650 [Lachnospiraceae bacterium]|nr:hypothetical protein [Lachnospiraceae bacterium]
MFTAKELNMVSRKYFRVVDIEEDVITLISKNTHHGWHIYRPKNEYQQVKNCILFHRHENQTEYHRHGYYKSLDEALDQIRRHDNFQINTRWKGKSFKEGRFGA